MPVKDLIIMNRCFLQYRVLRIGLKSPLSYRNAFRILTSLQRFTPCSRHVSTSRSLNQFYPPDGKRSDDKDKKTPDGLALLINFLSLIALGLSLHFFTKNRGKGQSPDDPSNQHQRTVSWREFVSEMLAKGEVEQIVVNPPNTRVFIKLHDNAVFKGQSVSSNVLPPVFQMEVPSLASFEDNLRKAERELGIPADQGVLVVYNRINASSYIILYAILGLATYILLGFGRKRGKFGSSMFTNMFDSLRKAKFRVVDSTTYQINENLKVKFSDVVGLKEAKIEIKEFVDYLKVPEKFTKLGAKLPKGALLLGPPGCGKTLLAKAVASEANVPFLATNGTEFVEMIGGLGAARVRDLFKEAKRRAPCMIYIDEIDAIGRRRSGESGDNAQVGNSEHEHTLNQLLVEMDGMDSSKGVVVIASTNRADILDKALLRRGRFDRHIDIDLPTLVEREEIFDYYLKKIKLEKEPSTYSKILAKLTPGFSGADINNVCNEAAIRAASAESTVVNEKYINEALDRVLHGPEKRSSTVSPEEKEVVAYHECGHALVGWLLEHTNALLKVTIVPRTSTALGFAQYNPQDKKLYSQDDLSDRMCMALAGRAAENVVFKRITTGADNDLKKVTQIAYDQVKNYGMSPAVGPLSFARPPGEEEYVFDKPYSKSLGNLIDREASNLVVTAYRRAEDILRTNRDKLDLLAKSLLKKETLTYDEVCQLIGPPPYGTKKTTELIDLELPRPIEDEESSPGSDRDS